MFLDTEGCVACCGCRGKHNHTQRRLSGGNQCKLYSYISSLKEVHERAAVDVVTRWPCEVVKPGRGRPHGEVALLGAIDGERRLCSASCLAS